MSDAKAPTAPEKDPDKPNEQEFGSSWRPLHGWQAGLFFWASVAFAAFHLLNLNYLAIDSIKFRVIHLCWGAALGFALVLVTAKDRSKAVPWHDWLLIAACGGVAAYILQDFGDWQMRMGAGYTTGDVIAACAGIFIVLEFTRRTAGWALTIIAAIFIVYGFVGPWMPGPLFHKGFNFRDWFTQMFSETGVFGQTLEVSSTFIILFVIFAAFLSRSGAGDYFNDLAMALVGWARGGPAKVAVLSGVMFGSISGSSVANVVASGTVTIPMMRRVGYDRATAAAVEATSSTGGQITPPVLGAGAFIMAEITKIPYGEIALAAIIPCLLFYVANYAHCHLHALKHGLHGVPRKDLPRLLPLLLKIYYGVPIFILFYAFITGYSAFRAAALGMIAAIAVSLLTMALLPMRPDKPALDKPLRAFTLLCVAALVAMMTMVFADIGGGRVFFALGLTSIAAALLIGWIKDRGYGGKPGDSAFGPGGMAIAFNSGTRDAIQLIAVCAAAGIVAGVIASTGIGGRFSYLMLSIAGEHKVLALIFAMVIVTILGMGMPTTAAYAIAASVVAPGLTRIGIEPLVAHMFIFYFAVLSAITPPVAVASFAAAAMAKADPWKTSWIAVRIGLATFIVPFLFFASPVLLGKGAALDVAQALITGMIGVYALACATEGWMNGWLNWPLRIVLVAAAICLLIPELWTDIAGIAVFVAVLAWQRYRHGRNPADKIPRAVPA